MLQTTEVPRALTLWKKIEGEGLVREFKGPGEPGILWRLILVATGCGWQWPAGRWS